MYVQVVGWSVYNMGQLRYRNWELRSPKGERRLRMDDKLRRLKVAGESLVAGDKTKKP